ncbi:hypothetical protein ACFVAV_17710 [Nocardia sp. NPDC057663]|uniref:hypothetical protein n=1 Tax=Nocardia sp. NPDC057663 TaxID=3346201 RepID=UPI00366AD603
MPIRRTDYWNRTGAVPKVRNGDSTHGETVTDIEDFVLPYSRATLTTLRLWGVGDGLAVTATMNTAGLKVGTGVSIDDDGRAAVLVDGGVALTDPTVAADAMSDVPTTPIDATGVALPTGTLTGPKVLTIRYREVAVEGLVGNAPTLVHAPWLRLLDAADVVVGTDIVLAQITLDAGKVTNVSSRDRRLAGLAADRLQLRAARADLGTFTVDQGVFGELRGTVDGVTLTVGGGVRRAVTVDVGGNVGLGSRVGLPECSLHVEGSQVHSGGAGGGLSFADRDVEEFVAEPEAGERWEWNSVGGKARLVSGAKELLSIGHAAMVGEGLGLDVARRMRVRRGIDAAAGIWFNQSTPAATVADGGYVGMLDDTHIGLFSADGPFGLKLDTNDCTIQIVPRPGQFDFFGFSGVAITVGGRSELQNHTNVHGGLTVTAPIGVVGGFVGPAAFFDGDVTISGRLSKGGGGFRIDHPLQPEGKYLSHSFVESPEMLNLYSGIVRTDARGVATIALPDWFEALNRDFTYQLTVLGENAHAFVTDEIAENSFKVWADVPGVRVSWLVTGVRRDTWADQHRIAVEEDKPEGERGHYLQPTTPEQQSAGPALRAAMIDNDLEAARQRSENS